MQYKSYEKDIVLHYGVELIGWTEGLPFACPSSLPTTLEPLQTLLQAIDDGTCSFRRLSSSDRGARRAAYQQKVTDGSVPARQTRKDKGKKRAPYRRRKEGDPERANDKETSNHEASDEEEQGDHIGDAKRRCLAGAGGEDNDDSSDS